MQVSRGVACTYAKLPLALQCHIGVLICLLNGLFVGWLCLGVVPLC
jgi:hypothetical protein